jgi:hypothetical protein
MMAAGGDVPTGPIRGRVAERQLVGRRIDGVAEGYGGVVVIDGPGGIGKSRLLFDALRIGQATGVSTLSARADATERFVPLAPLLSAVGRPAAAVHDTRGQLVAWLRSDLEVRAQRSGLLLALDDLDQAD